MNQLDEVFSEIEDLRSAIEAIPTEDDGARVEVDKLWDEVDVINHNLSVIKKAIYECFPDIKFEGWEHNRQVRVG
jgi:hypothetical protein